MAPEKSDVSRRNFLKTMGATGVGVLAGATAKRTPEAHAEKGRKQQVPTRPFGKTDERVSILALGGNGSRSDQLMMHQALKWGVTFWDVWDSDRHHGGGIPQKSVGQYFRKYPEARKKVFLMTKTDDRKPKALTAFLDKALSDMNVQTIDFFVIHSVSYIGRLHSKTRAWSERAKSDGKIRYFGVSAHSRMEKVMKGAVVENPI